MTQKPQNPTQQYRTMLEALPEHPENLTKLETIAENGDAEVMYILGWCYFKGEYLPKDLEKSIFWLEKAKIEGNEWAMDLLVFVRFFDLRDKVQHHER